MKSFVYFSTNIVHHIFSVEPHVYQSLTFLYFNDVILLLFLKVLENFDHILIVSWYGEKEGGLHEGLLSWPTNLFYQSMWRLHYL